MSPHTFQTLGWNVMHPPPPHEGALTHEGGAKFRLMFERSGDAILLLDTATNQFIEYNQAALDMLACTREELRSLHPSVLSPLRQPDGRESFEKANEMIATAVHKGSHRFEWIHRSPHREDFPVEVLLTPIQLGDSPMLVVVWRDITERKRSEDALRQTQKLESLGVLAGGIAHDFNNLLMAILGHRNLARTKLPDDHPVDVHLDQMEKATLRAADLTRQMLAYSGKGRFLVQPLDLNHCVQEISELLKVSISKRVKFIYNLGEGLPAIEADQAQVQQVVINLVTNAAEAIQAGDGTISIQTRWVTLDEEILQRDFQGQNMRSGAYVVLEVKDTGSGMTSDVVQKIFDPFFSTKQSGRGLGLSALQGILRGHQAGIRIQTELGMGTAFEVFFPTSEERVAQASASLQVEALKGRGRVLLVDDESTVRRCARAMLESLGFSVVEARDGQEALDIYEREAGKIHWVLMDLTMPRLDGYSAFLALRGLNPSVQVVLSSGWSHSEVTARFREHPPAAFLPKPYTLTELRASLTKAGVLI